MSKPKLRYLHLNRRQLLALTAIVPTLSYISPTVGAQTATPPSEQRQIPLSLYFLRQDERRGELLGVAHRHIPVPEGKAVAAASLQELIAGPTKEETAAGLTTAIPDDAAIHSISLDSASKVISVDLTPSFFVMTDDDPAQTKLRRIGQLVFTLTQFPTIESVDITVDGQPFTSDDDIDLDLSAPLTREDFEDILPLIFLESPAPGDTITSPVRLWGTANTFEATFLAQVRDADDAILIEQVVTATSGSGFRGTFDFELSFTVEDTAPGSVVVFEQSAKDGSTVNQVIIPVTLESA